MNKSLGGLYCILFIGMMVYCVMCSLEEMVTYILLSDGLAGYGTIYADPTLGFAMVYSP